MSFVFIPQNIAIHAATKFALSLSIYIYFRKKCPGREAIIIMFNSFLFFKRIPDNYQRLYFLTFLLPHGTNP